MAVATDKHALVVDARSVKPVAERGAKPAELSWVARER